MDISLLKIGQALYRGKPTVNVADVLCSGPSKDDICSRHMVHAHTQEGRGQEDQWIGGDNEEAVISTKDGFHGNYRCTMYYSN